MSNSLNYQALLKRFLLTLLLVFTTYNPTGLSYLDWLTHIISGNSTVFSPSFMLLTLIVCLCWVIYLKTLYRALGKTRTVITVILMALVLWWIFDLGLFQLSFIPIFDYLALIVVTLILTLALSWSHFHHLWVEHLKINKPNN